MKARHDGRRNTYMFEKDGERHVILPFKNEKAQRKLIQGNVT